MQLK
jgi:hypothetical protein